MLLQQLLRSIESSGTRHRAAITYAVLSLLVRLVASQSSVFNLWFSRRCYERSRGEMITMLYEKTLSRKVIGNPTQPQVSVDGMNARQTKRARSRIRSFWEGLYGTARRLFKRKDERPNESKMPASIGAGRILNMMRQASLAVLLVVSQLIFQMQQRCL